MPHKFDPYILKNKCPEEQNNDVLESGSKDFD
jgi:hypothetical protein